MLQTAAEWSHLVKKDFPGLRTHHISESFCKHRCNTSCIRWLASNPDHVQHLAILVYLQKQTTILRLCWTFCKRFQNGASSCAAFPKAARCLSSDVFSQVVPSGDGKWIQRWSQLIQDDPGRSQESRDGRIWSQMIADDPTWAQMLPDESQMDPNEFKWSQIIPQYEFLSIIFQLDHRRCLLPNAFSQLRPPE